MPRILPRLLQKIANKPLETKENHVALKFPHRPPRVLSRKPLPPTPSFSPVNRVQSILLDPVNPIIDSKEYLQHKESTPCVRLVKRSGEHDRPRRRMTLQEREWWASPYLRMLSAPLRKCFLTQRYLPTDFLIRLAPIRLPSPRGGREAQSLLPDGLEHSKFKNRKHGVGHYIVCWKAALEQLAERGSYKRLSPNLSMHSLLCRQIGHLLRVRVLQELEILADQIQLWHQSGKDHPVLRRLTRAEFKAIKATGVIPYDSGVAVLVVPPLNRNPITKLRPEPCSGPLPPENQEPTKLAGSSRHPLSTLHSVCDVLDHPDDLPDLLPHSHIPLYNGVALFPSRPQRAGLYAGLNRILFIERRARYREHGEAGAEPGQQEIKSNDKWARGDEKASHAFLLCSDAMTVRRGDVAKLAIALWRIRMWEGGGWEEGSEAGWVSDGLEQNQYFH